MDCDVVTLRELVESAFPDDAVVVHDTTDVRVTSVVQDAREVTPGALFVARVGAKVDGHDFVDEAVRRGAVAVAGTRHGLAVVGSGARVVPYVRVEDDRVAVARLASWVEGRPAWSTDVFGVTGTDGKTTTSTLLWWGSLARAKTALWSTAGARMGTSFEPTIGRFTTPEACDVQAFLGRAVRAGMDRVVLEASSHGLALARLDDIRFVSATWTNLTPEHLDFHGTMEAYAAAKATLVERAPVAILNRDDPWFGTFASAARTVISYGTDAAADWRILRVDDAPGSLGIHVGCPDGRQVVVQIGMVGAYNAWNVTAALATLATAGDDVDAIVDRWRAFPGVAGRMQVVQATPFSVIVDFAHTAPAVARALASVTPAMGGKRIVVVGAAGERDRGKRRTIGAAAARHADVALFTEEDSRSEPIDSILDEMLEGARSTGRHADRFVAIPDRRDAIAHAVAAARPGDVVLLLGKGHEATLERADETLVWDEVDEARKALAALR